MDIFTTQEGAVFDMEFAQCPKCESKSALAHYKAGRNDMGANFLCPVCGLLYDEPVFEPAEVAFVTMLDEEE